jgi:small GTP-binding protein
MEQKKLILVGDCSVGKTSFIKRICNRRFETRYITTAGCEVYMYTDRVNNIDYKIWDTSGQEKYDNLRDAYYFSTDIAIIICENDKSTHKTIDKWKIDIKRMCPEIPIYVVYNKTDVGTPIPKSVKSKIDCYISIKDNIGITDLFDSLAKN